MKTKAKFHYSDITWDIQQLTKERGEMMDPLKFVMQVQQQQDFLTLLDCILVNMIQVVSN